MGYQNQDGVTVFWGFFRGEETFEGSVLKTMKNALFPVLSPRATLTLSKNKTIKKKKENQESCAEEKSEGGTGEQIDGGILPGFSGMDGGWLGEHLHHRCRWGCSGH